MKQISRFLSFAAAAAMCFSACSPEELKNGEVNVSKFVTVHFGTENTDPASTKATLTPTDEYETAFQAAWEKGDEISIEYISPEYNNDIITGTWDATNKKFSANLPNEKGAWDYQAAYPVPSASDNSVDFGSNRTQKGNTYNSKYDIMIGAADTKNSEAGKDDNGNDIVFPMTRQTAIAYFHFTSALDEAVISATLKVTDGAIANSSASINEYFKFVAPQENDLTEINLTFEEGTAPSAKDFQLWFNVLPTTYTKMTLTVETATKTFTISNTKGGSYTAGKLYKVKKEGIAWTDKAVTPSGPTITKITSASAFTAGTYIIMTYDESYYVPNAAATNAGPKLGNVVKTDGVITITPEMIWNATVSGEGLEFTSYLEPDKKLWGAPTNNGVRVNDNSTSNNPSSVWKLESITNYGLCGYAGISGTDKYYLSTYGTQDWRNYKYSNSKFGADGNIPANFFKVEGWVDSNHSISIATVEGGTLSASPTSAAEGTEVTLTATPDAGYEFNNDWTVKDADGAKIDVYDGKFKMPAKDVTVSGSFSKVDYTITKADCEGGSFTVKKNGEEVTKAQIGESITLTASAAEGYEFDSWSVTNETTSKSVYVNENTFTMPGANVTVSANFLKADEVPVYASVADLIAAGTPTSGGENVTVTLSNEEITKFYTTKAGDRRGVYFTVGTQEIELFGDIACPKEWVAGGWVSGTLIKCKWMIYNGTWELCPSDWSALTYAAPCETPDITLDGAVATITCATEGATIHYTLDGKDPVETSDVYTAAVTLTDGQTIKAKAFLTGHKPSEVASKTYSSTGGETKSFIKLKSSLTDYSGEYLMLHSNDYVVSGYNSNNDKLSTVALSPAASDTILETDVPETAAVLTIEASSVASYYKIKFSDGNYLGYDSSTDFKQSTTSNTDAFLWSISIDNNGNATITNKGTSTRIIKWYSSGKDFRPYTTQNNDLPVLYKKN